MHRGLQPKARSVSGRSGQFYFEGMMTWDPEWVGHLKAGRCSCQLAGIDTRPHGLKGSPPLMILLQVSHYLVFILTPQFLDSRIHGKLSFHFKKVSSLHACREKPEMPPAREKSVVGWGSQEGDIQLCRCSACATITSHCPGQLQLILHPHRRPLHTHHYAQRAGPR